MGEGDRSVRGTRPTMAVDLAGDDAAFAVAVLVQEAAVDHVGDGLETAMRMPVGAAGFIGPATVSP